MLSRRWGRLPSGSRKLTTSAKALTAGSGTPESQGAPRLLEVPNEALVTNGGPPAHRQYHVKEDGSVQYANHLTLCRCGSFKSKPT
jgi:hypothetical protein